MATMPEAGPFRAPTGNSGTSPGTVSIREMSVRSVLALGLLALLSIGGFLLLERSFHAQERAVNVVRVSGRQRVLTQRVVLLAVRLLNTHDPVATRRRIEELHATAREIEATHESMIHGDGGRGIGDSLTPEVRAIYFAQPHELDQRIRSFVKLARRLARGSEVAIEAKGPQLLLIDTLTAAPILEDLSLGFDSLLEQFQRESELRIRETRRVENWILATMLVVLLSMGMFVFRPMVLRVRRDIEELQRAQIELSARAEALERSNLELEQFAYVASHDLQEPLRMITAYVQLLQRRYGGRLGQDADECIQFASEGAVRMHDLIEDLLAYSRVGTHGGEMRSIDLECVLQDVLADMKVAIEESSAHIVSDPLPRVRADPLQMGQLFRNLIGNAIKFRRSEPPRIQIVCRRDGQDWHLSMSDNGIGLDMRFANRIFIIYQRLHNRDQNPGTGVGLAN
jgi:signal transduction histidine kinase